MKGVVTFPAVHPGIPLAVVVLVPDPVVKPTSSFGRDDVIRGALASFLEPIDMPLSDVAGLVASISESMCNRGHLRRKLALVAVHRMVRVSARQERASCGAAERCIAHGTRDVQAVICEPIQVRREDVWVARAAQCLGAMLVAEYPDDVGPLLTHESRSSRKRYISQILTQNLRVFCASARMLRLRSAALPASRARQTQIAT